MTIHRKKRLLLVCLYCSVALAATTWSAEPERPLVVGHRGLLHAAPENTLAGFTACLELRVGFEFDVRRSKDGELVCLHDATVDRTTNGKGPLAELLSKDVFRLDAGGWFGRRFRGERVPRVAEILSQIEKRGSEATLIAVDLKETGDGIEESLIRLAERHHVLDRLVFIGETIESNEVRGRLRAASPNAQLARLAPAADKVGEVIDDRQANWVYVRFLPSPESVGQVHRAGKRLFLAGPLVASEMRENWTQAAGLGIDAVLTDFPLELSRMLRESDGKH